MDLTFSDEQKDLQSVVRAFLHDVSPEEEVRRLMQTPSGYDAEVWTKMSDQLGLQGLAVPEDLGGAGAGALEVGIVAEEMGRALFGAPFLSTCVLATQAILAADDPGCSRELLPGIACGVTVATLAFTEPGRPWDAPAERTTVRRSGGRWLLDGAKELVLDGAHADLVLVTARGEQGVGLYAVSADAAGLTRTPSRTLDPTRKLARLEFAGVPAHPVGPEDAAGRILSRVLDHASAVLAAEAVGVAQHLLDVVVAHVKDRVQFGRPIGAFQAVQHACAHMYVEVESARAAAHHALWSAAAGSPDLPLAASLAKACCTDSAMRVAAEAIQLLGGIGVTWEHPAHLYFRRAKSSQLIFGGTDQHRDALVRRLDAQLTGA
ncbi:acyl-CoA dehydrogenase family protein [Actinocorallia populi]|uniref:acyl-CoA dehydrogenase family protein n=1 Tax=Actinocorallia populi TaxID=2079200 RepID=UPI000D0942EA|nr:acyl-CoA dehydrogenase family protein [Actinocorallia populi]